MLPQKGLLLKRALLSLSLVLLTGCTMSRATYSPKTGYADASTPTGMNEYNGGYIDDVTVKGRSYSVLTPNGAALVAKWQGNRNGFIKVRYNGIWMTAIDKGVMRAYDFH